MLEPDEIERLMLTAPLAAGFVVTEHETSAPVYGAGGGVRLEPMGDPVKPILRLIQPDGSVEIVFGFRPRAPKEYRCVSVSLADVSDGRAVGRSLGKRGWWGETGAAKHFNDMVGGVRGQLELVHRAPHQGLQDDGAFLLNNHRVGASAKNYRIFPEDYIPASRAGSLAGWQEWTSRAAQFPMIAFALSAGFANLPKLALNHPGFSINFSGSSTTGKTFLLRSIASLLRDPNSIDNWSMTRAGLEGWIHRHSHTPMIIDELLSGADAKRDPTLAYLMANERLKTRAPGYGGGQPVQIVLFSTMENDRSIPRPSRGADVRWLNVPICHADGGVLFGKDADADGAGLIDGFLADARAHHGWALEHFAEQLLSHADWRKLCAAAYDKAERQIGGGNLTSVEQRGGGRFALCAAAGELAAELGIGLWPPGCATDAAALAFESWRNPPAADVKPVSVAMTGASCAAEMSTADQADQILRHLGSQAWRYLADLKSEGDVPDPTSPDSPPFIHVRGDTELVCAGTAYLRHHLGGDVTRALTRLKQDGKLSTNASAGLQLSIKVGGKALQFVAIPLTELGAVEVEGAFNPFAKRTEIEAPELREHGLEA